jgi:hypothetical protein
MLRADPWGASAEPHPRHRAAAIWRIAQAPPGRYLGAPNPAVHAEETGCRNGAGL